MELGGTSMFKKTMTLLMAFCLIFCLNVGFTSAETTSTDVFKDAEALKFDSAGDMSGASTMGVLKDQSDAKFYLFEMKKNGGLDFSAQQNQKVEIGVTLYDASGQEYGTYYADKGNEEENLFGQGLPKGTYYLKVFVYDGTGETLPYKLDVIRIYDDQVETERNNTLQTATPIKVGKDYVGFTDQSDADDLYRFTTTKDGYLHLKGTFGTDSDLNYRLLNDAGEVLEDWILEAYDDYTFASIFTKYLKAGTYYISVKQERGDFFNEEYQISTVFIDSKQFEKEANNSIKQANLVSANTLYHGLINKKRDKDFYKFNVSKGKTFALNFKRLEDTAFKVKVLNSKGKLVKTFTTKKGEDGFVKLGNLNLSKGTYYLDVEYLQGESENVLYNFSLK